MVAKSGSISSGSISTSSPRRRLRRSDQAKAHHVAYVLLAEFDIDSGSGLRHEFPHPTGADPHLLAEFMLPDGSHLHEQDWTIFFLNTNPAFSVIPPTRPTADPNAVPPPVLSHKASNASLFDTARSAGSLSDGGGFMQGVMEDSEVLEGGSDGSRGKQKGSGSGHRDGDPLFVMSLVRTKHDPEVRRGALVKALAVCSYEPYIQIYKPLLLLALEEYFREPSIKVLSRLYDRINAMDISSAPRLSYNEKLVLRCTERKDIFEEKFRAGLSPVHQNGSERAPGLTSSSSMQFETNSQNSSGFLDDTEASNGNDIHPNDGHADQRSLASVDSSSRGSNDDDLPTATLPTNHANSHAPEGGRPRANTAASSVDVPLRPRKMTDEVDRPPLPNQNASIGFQAPGRKPKDTHFFDTRVLFEEPDKQTFVPIRLPLATFPEEVGDYSLITLISTFSKSNTLNPSAPLHPHLHTSGHATHPVILLFNALVTEKRVVFLGHGRPAGEVANLVLAACALGSGCGTVLQGYLERAIPYANLSIAEKYNDVPGYIAGVTNPRFEDLTSMWDVLCNIETNKITISKDIKPVSPSTRSFSPGNNFSRTMSDPPSSAVLGTLPFSMNPPAGGIGASPSGDGDVGRAPNGVVTAPTVMKVDPKAESPDNIFMEEIMSMIGAHFSESVIRARFTDYVQKFVRRASRYEAEIMGSTSIGYTCQSFSLGILGSGPVFPDEQTRVKELTANINRIEGWRKSGSYPLFQQEFRNRLEQSAIKGIDLAHQCDRLRSAKKMSSSEVELIFTTLARIVKSEEQVIELLAHLPSHLGGLSPVAFGMFHTSEVVRESVVDLLDTLNAYPTGRKFLQSLNAFHRLAYLRLSQARVDRTAAHSSNPPRG